MELKRLTYIKDCLMCVIEKQMECLHEVDTEELGQAIDMLKDMEEAIYYFTITEAMEGKSKYGDVDFDSHYEDNGTWSSWKPETAHHTKHESKHDKMEEHETMMESDIREGRSHHNRKMYLEAREKKHDKAIQLRELEKYMQELSSDMVDMIQEASVEEKQYLEKKISALASKIGQMK